MPSPFLRSTGGYSAEFYCSLCKTRFKSKMPGSEQEKSLAQAKAALMKEWEKHLADAHPRQWEREQKKRARRRARGTAG